MPHLGAACRTCHFSYKSGVFTCLLLTSLKLPGGAETVGRIFLETSLKIEMVPVGKVIPNAANPRDHPEWQVAQIAASIEKFGFSNPILLSKSGTIIAGHGRLLAAKKLGWEKVKVIQVPVSRDIAIKARLADNLMSNQKINHDNLLKEVEELSNLVDGDLGLDGIMIDQGTEDLLNMEGMESHLAYILASKGIVTMEDLAEQAIDDLKDIEGVDEERAAALIMTARAPWFASEQ